MKSVTTLTRTRQDRDYLYDPNLKLYLNDQTGRWVKNPDDRRQRVKAKTRMYKHPMVDTAIKEVARNDYEEECIRYLLNVIAARQHLRKQLEKDQNYRHDKSTVNECSWLPYELYSRILGRSHCRRILTELVDKGVLKEEVYIYAKGRLYRYAFASETLLSGYSLVPISFNRLNSKIKSYGNWKMANIPSHQAKVVSHIIDNFVRIKIEEKELDQLWEHRYESKYLKRHTKNPKTKDEYMECGKDVWKIVNHWNTLEQWEKVKWFNPCDSFGHRLHHIFSYLPSELRAHIVDADGKPLTLVEFDLVNSQPAILANELVKRYGQSMKDDPFIRAVEERLIYEDMAKRLGISRDEAKVEMLHSLYSMVMSKAHKRFEEIYPHVGLILNQWKSVEYDESGKWLPFRERHKELPKLMQRCESKMFREVWRRLMNQGYTILPVHDAVYIVNATNEQLRYAKSIVIRVLREEFRIYFKVE